MTARSGERAEHAHAAQVLGSVVESECAVGQAADGGVLARVAQVLVAGGAVAAGAADRDVGAGHPVACLYSRDTGAGLLDHAGALVPADQGQPGQAGGADVLVGMAQARGLEPDEDLAGLGLVQVEFGEFPRLAALAEHRGPGLHGVSLWSGSVWLANSFHITRFSSSKVSYIVSPELRRWAYGGDWIGWARGCGGPQFSAHGRRTADRRTVGSGGAAGRRST